MKKKIQQRWLLGVALLALAGATGAFAQAQIPLPGSAIPQFVDPLPPLDVIVDNGVDEIVLEMEEFQAPVLSTGTLVPGVAPLTWAWGYLQPSQVGPTPRPSYLGPVIVATKDQPTQVRYRNNLGNTATTHVLAYKNSTDQTLHWADPLNGEMSHGNHMVAEGCRPWLPVMRTTPARSRRCRTCTAGMCRRSSTAARTPGSPATAPTRGTGTTRTRGCRRRAMKPSTATPTARRRRRSGSTTTPWAPPGSTSTPAWPAPT